MAYNGGGVPSVSRSVDQESIARSRYLSHVQRRSMPPRFRPGMIILFVMSIGMIFIGLVMTIIAHWPGYSSPGGKAALEIGGPIILSLGALIFIVGLVMVYRRNQEEKKKWAGTMHQIANSRSNILGPRTPTPSVDAKPARSILKKTPSSSTYHGSDAESARNSGVNGYPGIHGPGQYHHDTSSGSDQQMHQVYKIETMPDPSAANQEKKNKFAAEANSSTDSESHVPVPVRYHVSKKKASRGDHSITNSAYSTDGEVFSPQANTPQQTYPTPGGNYNQYNSSQTPQSAKQPSNGDSSGSQRRRRRRKHRDQPQPEVRQQAEQSYSPDTSGQGYTLAGQGLAGQGLAGQGLAGQGLAGQGLAGQGLAGAGIPNQAYAVDPRYTPQEQDVRIHIKAKPGTAVHITPGTEGYHQQQYQQDYQDGYQQGYDQQGYDQQGYDQQGYDQQGYDQRGYEQGAYQQSGYQQDYQYQDYQYDEAQPYQQPQAPYRGQYTPTRTNAPTSLNTTSTETEI